MMQKLIVAGGLIVALAIPSALTAGELSRTKIGGWGDPLTPAQSRTSCIGYASGDWPWGGGWKSCNQWKTEWKHMEVEGYLVISGPDKLSDTIKKAATQCALTTVAAAAGTGLATAGAGAAAAIAAAKVAFAACMAASGARVRRSILHQRGYT
jgi:hypothetical protein